MLTERVACANVPVVFVVVADAPDVFPEGFVPPEFVVVGILVPVTFVPDGFGYDIDADQK